MWANITDCKACGYSEGTEYEDDYGIGKGEDIGDEEFIIVDGHFTITKTYDYASDEIKMVRLLACPKCKTIRLED